MIETTAPVSICMPTGCLLINTLTVNRLDSVPFPCTQLLTVNKEYSLGSFWLSKMSSVKCVDWFFPLLSSCREWISHGPVTTTFCKMSPFLTATTNYLLVIIITYLVVGFTTTIAGFCRLVSSRCNLVNCCQDSTCSLDHFGIFHWGFVSLCHLCSLF